MLGLEVFVFTFFALTAQSSPFPSASVAPTNGPTATSSSDPTAEPTASAAPTAAPSASAYPTAAPSASGSPSSSSTPTASPSGSPSPSSTPTASPSSSPSSSPTASPTIAPTAPPTFPPSSCTGVTPSAPRLISPTPNQTAAPLNPQFYATLDGCSFGQLKIGPDSNPNCFASTNSTIDDGLTTSGANLFGFKAYLDFVSDTQFYWCVIATNKESSSLRTASVVQGFKTQSSLVPAPKNPYTNPDTPSANDQTSLRQNLNLSNASHQQTSSLQASQVYSGQAVIEVGAYGEQGSIMHFFLKKSDNRNVEVGSVRTGSDPNGKSQIVVNVTQFANSRSQLQFYAQIERPMTGRASVRGPLSTIVSYYFDPSLSLLAPTITKLPTSTDPNLIGVQWAAIPRATRYKVWRRIGKEECGQDANLTGSSLSSSAVCFLGNRPFQLVADISSLSFDDTTGLRSALTTSSNPSGIIPADGVSYFVTAHDDQGNASLRSISVSFRDSVAPIRQQQETIDYLPLVGGTDAIGFLCELGEAEFFDGDNSPDLIADIHYSLMHPEDPHDPNYGAKTCSSADFNYDAAEVSHVTSPFDSLLSGLFTNSLDYSKFDCAILGRLSHLLPQANAYCVRTCLVDPSGSSERICVANGVNTARDYGDAEFAGVDSLEALDSGTGIRVNWLPANVTDETREIVQYSVQMNSGFDSDGSPLFPGNENLKVTDHPSDLSLTFEGLQTGANYCFQASSIDNKGGINTPPGAVKCMSTRNNKPIITDLTILPSNTGEDYKIVLRFRVVSREAGLSDYLISVDHVQYRLAEGNWIDIQPVHLSAANMNNLFASSSISSAPSNDVIFNTLAYFAGEQNFEVQMRLKDTYGNTGDYTISHRQTIFEGMSKISGFSDQGLSGCSLQFDEKSPHLLGLVILLGISAIAILFLRRRFIP